MNVKGLSIKDIMNIDLDTFNSLGERELKQITSRLVSASNKRIRSLESKGINSPSVRALGSKRAFSVRLPKNSDITQRVNKIRTEFARARKFLSSKTSTIKGYKEYVKETKEQIERETGRSLSDVDVGKVFEILHKAQQSGIVQGRGSAGSIHAREMIIDMLNDNPNATLDDYLDWLDNQYTEWYEENEFDDETDETDFDW